MKIIKVNLTNPDCHNNFENNFVPLNCFGIDKWNMFKLSSIISCDDVKCNSKWIPYECCDMCIFNDSKLISLKYLDDNGDLIIEEG